MPIPPVTQLLGSRLPCSASDSAASRPLWRSKALSWVPSLSEAVSNVCTVPRNGCMAGLARKKVFHTASRCCCRAHGPVSWCIKACLRCAACTYGHASLVPAVNTYMCMLKCSSLCNQNTVIVGLGLTRKNAACVGPTISCSGAKMHVSSSAWTGERSACDSTCRAP